MISRIAYAFAFVCILCSVRHLLVPLSEKSAPSPAANDDRKRRSSHVQREGGAYARSRFRSLVQREGGAYARSLLADFAARTTVHQEHRNNASFQNLETHFAAPAEKMFPPYTVSEHDNAPDWAAFLEDELSTTTGFHPTTVPIFGYGSLVARSSAAQTILEPAARASVQSVLAFNLKRVFEVHVPLGAAVHHGKPCMGESATAMLNVGYDHQGADFAEGGGFHGPFGPRPLPSVANGVLYHVGLDDFRRLRRRESVYNVVPVVVVRSADFRRLHSSRGVAFPGTGTQSLDTKTTRPDKPPNIFLHVFLVRREMKARAFVVYTFMVTQNAPSLQEGRGKLPRPGYYELARDGFFDIGGLFEKNKFLDTTFYWERDDLGKGDAPAARLQSIRRWEALGTENCRRKRVYIAHDRTRFPSDEEMVAECAAVCGADELWRKQKAKLVEEAPV